MTTLQMWLACLLLITTLSGCAGPQHVSAAEFEQQYTLVSQPSTIKAATYLGQQDGRASLRISSMSLVTRKWSDRVIYAEVSELDSTFCKSLPIRAEDQR